MTAINKINFFIPVSFFSKKSVLFIK